MAAAIAALGEKESIVPLITFAQALTVLGLPAIAAALVYLGTRPDLRARGHFPRWLLGLTTIGLSRFLRAGRLDHQYGLEQVDDSQLKSARLDQIDAAIRQTAILKRPRSAGVVHAI